MSRFLHEAITNIHNNVVSVFTQDNATCAYDVDGNEVIIDANAVATEVERLAQAFEDTSYQRKRAAEYPPVTDYLDAVVKNDTEQMQAYIDACLAVKAKYPKPE